MKVFVVPSGRSAQIIVTTYCKNTQQDHASTSAYKEATSIRNNLLGALKLLYIRSTYFVRKKWDAISANHQNLLLHMQNQ